MTSIGVATAGFQVEGGFNAWGQPTNNWADWELRGWAEPSGEACRFWDRPEWLLDRAAALGCDRFRMSLEWARVQPGFDIADASAPPYDDTALDGYADLVSSCRDRGLEPNVTLQHFTHPRWIGVDLWGSSSKLPFFDDYVDTVVLGVGTRLRARGEEPVREWITINEPNVLALAGGLAGRFPGARHRGLRTMVRWLDHLMAAHCRAYDRIHDIYERNAWPEPLVSTNNYVLSLYPLDRMLLDMLLARENGVGRDELPELLAEGEAAFDQPWTGSRRGQLVAERMAALAARRAVTPERLPFALDAIYSSDRSQKLDYVAIDWYDPVAGRQLRTPGRLAGGTRRWSAQAELDEQVADPSGMAAAVRRASVHAKGKPVVIAENGLCNLWPKGASSQPRPDGLDRPEFLRSHLREMESLRDEGTPLAGYYHWTVADNYEWGSYAPRFGIHAVERRPDGIQILDHDAMGGDSAGCFRKLVDALGTS